jgi:pimeloyl-ACP methyl ester carboxylesterase
MTPTASLKPKRRISRLNIILVLLGIAGAVTACFVRLDVDPQPLEAKYASDPASRFVEAAGMRFHITDRGQGQVIVLLHGQSINLLAWQPAAELLAVDHRVISVDLPGHGLTGPDPQSRYSPEQIAGSIDALATALGLDHFALAGNSLGGGIAVAYALDHPNKLDALILVDALGAPPAGPVPLIFRLQAAAVLGDLIQWFTPQWMVRLALADTFGDASKLTDDEVNATYEQLLRSGNRVAERQTLQAAAGFGVADRIATLTTPTLVLWGSRDSWIVPADAAWFGAHIPGASVQIFDGLGHMPMLEAPGVTVPAMEQFLHAHGA